MMTTVGTDRGRPFGLRRLGGRTLWSTALAVFWVALLVGIIGTYSRLNWTWTGFRDNGNLWSWLQLLSAPVFLAALPFVIKDVQGRQENKPSKGVEHDSPQDAEEQQHGQQAYQTYILDMMLNKNLGSPNCAKDVRDVARVKTLAALRRAGRNQKCEVLRFIYEAGLIDRHMGVVRLSGADLSGANLTGVTLSGSDLTGVDLSNAILRGTDLSGACLSNVKLTGADLTDADLSGACLEGAAYAEGQLTAARRWPQIAVVR
jgi:hypothetical protein